ncbi:Protein CBG20395 [Caenorhabditis briggsae]|uniref:Protein CBG20395 n=1 Tax=Caenorhabditis briggsae TaxID=6238 RepID=A8XXP2_CAEBR|nr:Protein CBG20395 [Caenorhabditis briggsae]CAP37411.2 Protein CBG20395 [Caenorhabditis briggsae]
MNFFNKPDPKELERANKRELRKTNRDLESDRRQMDRREKELEQEIKKLAAKGHNDAARHLAKQLIQLRNQKTKSVGMSARISGIQAQNSVKTMKEMNKQMPLEKVAANMREFQMAQEKMGLTEEMMNDTLDSILDAPGDADEQDAIVAQVLDEIGIEMNSKLANVPTIPTRVGAASASTPDDLEDLEAKLAKLRS